MKEPYKHIFITGYVSSEKYRTSPRPAGGPSMLPRDRAAHSQKLLTQLEAVWKEKERLQAQRTAEQITTREGTYLLFTSAVGCDLITKSLEDMGKGIRLLNVKEIAVGEDQRQIQATVYVPHGKESHFINEIQKYQQEETKSGKPKNAPLVDSIEDVSTALLEGLWVGNPQLMPTESAKWCEAWLNVNTNENQEQEEIMRFHATLEGIGIEHKTSSIIFPERAVLLIQANRSQLVELMLQSDLLAEFRSGQELAGLWINESAIEQQAWVDDLLKRIEFVDSNIKVCLLDSGVNNGHQLLEQLIDDTNTLTVDPAWGTYDHEKWGGHGTLRAGIAGYGKMEDVLTTASKIQLSHKLCSVKILPPPTQEATGKELWGHVTAQGVSKAEIQNPNMLLIYCMSVTSTEDAEQGRPSSWSGEVDNIAFGKGEDQRLIIVSAGNTCNDELWQQYNPKFNSAIQNPAQSWNALVVGAYTEKIQVNDDSFRNHMPVANQGELSPYSSTSLSPVVSFFGIMRCFLPLSNMPLLGLAYRTASVAKCQGQTRARNSPGLMCRAAMWAGSHDASRPSATTVAVMSR